MNSPDHSDDLSRCTVLFVCSGNTCRSPLAEAILEKLAADQGKRGVEAVSAGVNASPGEPASRGAQLIAGEHGLDLSRKTAQRLSIDLIDRADLVLVMEPRHRTDVLNLVPSADEKVHVLASLAPGRGLASINDPFGGSIEEYRRCFDELRDVITEALPQMEARIRRLADGRGPRRH